MSYVCKGVYLQNKALEIQNILIRHVGHMADWFACFAAQNLLSGHHRKPPPSLSYAETGLPIEICANLKMKHKSLELAADKIIKGGASDKSEDFESLRAKFKDYIDLIVKISEQTLSDSQNAARPLEYDDIRSRLQREMKRLERNNTSFCLANLAIDQPEHLKNTKIQERLKREVDDILRSFDDSYSLGKTEMVLCLKDIDLLDAASVLERLCKKIAAIEFEGHFITLSCAVVEPAPGDNIDHILEGVKKERIKAQKEGGNTVYEHLEKSPLARLAEDQNKD